MQYINYYPSPLGRITLAADEIGLTGLWLEGQKYYAGQMDREHDEWIEKESPVLTMAKHWLEEYFAGKVPEAAIPMHLKGTPFQMEVWEILCQIPYGQTITYGQIARQIAAKRGRKTMSAQAVGGAVGRNPISIIVPCHRVMGADGSLTGYAGGVDKKIALLTLEGVNLT
ncbi:MAG: methylated-DNA--[Lachnospiraceae bacterium]|nr:methylated-DNA--[protein]-cysteine S-methyltransferase [Lachnospiraceae bacterium]